MFVPVKNLNGQTFLPWMNNTILDLKWLPTVTVQLNIDQSLRYQNDLAFRFLMLKNSLKIMKTSFVLVNQEIGKQKLDEKSNRVSKSHAFLDFQTCACAQ